MKLLSLLVFASTVFALPTAVQQCETARLVLTEMGFIGLLPPHRKCCKEYTEVIKCNGKDIIQMYE
jgi:hypothetical protein